MSEEENIRRPQTISDSKNPTDEQQPEEIIPVEETAMPEEEDTIIDQPQTDDMEVHHHTHTTHGKKNWKAYFWEFLMLFLAVFCGFLAEYQLEHKIEHDRELQFITSLVEDLQDDETSIQRNISGNSCRRGSYTETGSNRVNSITILSNG